MNAVSEDFFVKNVILNDVTIENTSIALNIWEELPGLKNFIPWECVGHPEEVQLYFYKVKNMGVDRKRSISVK